MTQQHPRPQAATADGVSAFFADRRLLMRNITFLTICNLGWNVVLAVVSPLMLLHMKDSGVSNTVLGTVQSVNLWIVSVLVMYFSWRSDRTVSRWDGGVPYLFISAPFIIVTVALFPCFDAVVSLVILYAVQLLFMDMKMSTFVLLPIDLIPRERLGRINAVVAMIAGLVGFLALRYGFRSSDLGEWVPYLGGAAIMFLSTLAALAIREPPVRSPATGPFRPWSALAIGWADRRTILLMLGVGSVHSFLMIYNTWIWILAKESLGLERTAIAVTLSWSPLIGIALAWPVGWIIDRFGGLRVVIIYMALQVATFVLAMRVHDQNSLLWASVLATVTGSLYIGADMMVWKLAPVADVGSFTSANSFTRNLYMGILPIVSALLIDHHGGGNYKMAFVFGMVMSVLGFSMFFLYRHLMRRPAAGLSAEGGPQRAGVAPP